MQYASYAKEWVCYSAEKTRVLLTDISNGIQTFES